MTFLYNEPLTHPHIEQWWHIYTLISYPNDVCSWLTNFFMRIVDISCKLKDQEMNSLAV